MSGPARVARPPPSRGERRQAAGGSVRNGGGQLISSVRGEVLSIGLDHAVVEVGGVGLAVQATPNTLATLRRGQQARLATALVVREDSLTLFGFTDDEQRDVFGLLQSVAGIGPRMALATLAVLDPDALATALVEGDVKTLTRVPGIGPKVAQRMVAGAQGQGRRPDGGARARPTAVRRRRSAPGAGRRGAGRARVRREARGGRRRPGTGRRGRIRRERTAARRPHRAGSRPMTDQRLE